MIAIVVGGGINGVTAAIELRKRGHRVSLIDPGPLPHRLAASTDISKAVRAAYGADDDYTALADRSIERWHEWNRDFGVELYHETGFLFMRRREMAPGDFEYESFERLMRSGHRLERIDSAELRRRFPAWNAELYRDGFFDSRSGYVESERVVAHLLEFAKSHDVELLEGSKFAGLNERDGVVSGVTLAGRRLLPADIVVAAMGAWTPLALPFTREFFRTRGQPVFHLKPQNLALFASERFPVFGADISTTGYYGFPLNRDGIVKIANHGPGREMSPDSERSVTAEEVTKLRQFLAQSFPALADAEIVHSHVCLYCDTFDGDLWIAADPDRAGLIVAAGDNGHGFKFAPVLGEIIADAAEGKANSLLKKFRWRPEVRASGSKEAARAGMAARSKAPDDPSRGPSL
ncbi:MAG: FAD-dependent oxidoreductase [Chthoniobacterales bacterium]